MVIEDFRGQCNNCQLYSYHMLNPGGVHYVFWVQGRAIGKAIDFPHIVISNGIDFYNFGIRNRTDFQDFSVRFTVLVYFIRKFGIYKVDYTFSKNWYKEWRVCFLSLDGTSPTKIWSSASCGMLSLR